MRLNPTQQITFFFFSALLTAAPTGCSLQNHVQSTQKSFRNPESALIPSLLGSASTVPDPRSGSKRACPALTCQSFLTGSDDELQMRLCGRDDDLIMSK